MIVQKRRITMIRGIDVSVWQGDIDFEKVKADGIGFVIIRAGYGSSVSQRDKCFEQNYSRAKAAGLDVGAYWYSYADSAESAKQEAKACLEVIKGKTFEYPIFFDLEEKSQFDKGKAFCDSLVKTFCTELEKAGYFAGLYCSTYWLTNFVSKEVASRYTLWIAQYANKCTYSIADYGIWQCSCKGRVNGIGGDVDLDCCYKDYPSVIKGGGFNGYGKTESVKPAKTVDELAREVLAGKWGNGTERREKLTAAGYDYSAVQERVNELLQKPQKSVTELAKEVIQGKWGNGDERRKKLTAAGYSYSEVQKKVNELLK